MATLINRPFGGGGLLRRLHSRPVPAWAADLGCRTWSQLLLKWVISHPAVTCAIPGTAKLAYLEDNLAASRGVLPDQKTRAKMIALLESA